MSALIVMTLAKAGLCVGEFPLQLCGRGKG